MLELFLVYELYLVYLGAKVRVAALLLLAGRLLAHPGGEQCHQHLGRFPFAVLCGLPLSGCRRLRRGADPGAARARSCPYSPPFPTPPQEDRAEVCLAFARGS